MLVFPEPFGPTKTVRRSRLTSTSRMALKFCKRRVLIMAGSAAEVTKGEGLARFHSKRTDAGRGDTPRPASVRPNNPSGVDEQADPLGELLGDGLDDVALHGLPEGPSAGGAQ